MKICPLCLRPMDDHQLKSVAGPWLLVPMCTKPGEITKGIRLGGGKIK